MVKIINKHNSLGNKLIIVYEDNVKLTLKIFIDIIKPQLSNIEINESFENNQQVYSIQVKPKNKAKNKVAEYHTGIKTHLSVLREDEVTLEDYINLIKEELKYVEIIEQENKNLYILKDTRQTV